MRNILVWTADDIQSRYIDKAERQMLLDSGQAVEKKGCKRQLQMIPRQPVPGSCAASLKMGPGVIRAAADGVPQFVETVKLWHSARYQN